MHTKDKLADALRRIGLPEMAEKAATGYYDDYLSPLGAPIVALVGDLKVVGTSQARALARQAMAGDFDATAEEAEAWAASPDGQATMAKLYRP